MPNWQPRILLYSAILLGPFFTFRIAGSGFTYSDLMFILCSMALAVTGSTKLHLPPLSAGKAVFFWLGGGIALILGFVISGILSANITFNTFSVILQYLLVSVVLILLISMFPYEDGHDLIHIFIIGLFINVSIGLFLFYMMPTYYQYLMAIDITTETAGRFGSFIGVNALAKTISLVLPTCLYFIIVSEKKYTYTLIMLVLGIGLISTGSISGFISSVIAVSCFIIISIFLCRDQFEPRLSNKVVRIAPLMIIIGILGISQMSLFRDRILGSLLTLDPQEFGSFNIRINQISEALTYITSNPYFGLGAGGYQLITDFTVPVHNTYILVWVEGGIISFFGLIMIILAFYLISFQSLLSNRDLKSAALVATVIPFSMNMMTSTYSYARIYWIPVVILIYYFGYKR